MADQDLKEAGVERGGEPEVLGVVGEVRICPAGVTTVDDAIVGSWVGGSKVCGDGLVPLCDLVLCLGDLCGRVEGDGRDRCEEVLLVVCWRVDDENDLVLERARGRGIKLGVERQQVIGLGTIKDGKDLIDLNSRRVVGGGQGRVLDHRGETEMEPGDDSKELSASTDGKEEIPVGVGVSKDGLARGSDDVDSDDVVDSCAVQTRSDTHAALEEEATDGHAR